MRKECNERMGKGVSGQDWNTNKLLLLFVCLPLIVVCCMIVVVVCLPLIVSIKASSQIVFDSIQYLMLAIQIPSNT